MLFTLQDYLSGDRKGLFTLCDLQMVLDLPGALHCVCTMRAMDLLGCCSCKRSDKELKIEGKDSASA